ncbi:oligoendopeptidase, partial [Microbacteriaceae bacterium K1510]|nr:oligoendopeptidase [Microbacteriaceae bacterium K1510]
RDEQAKLLSGRVKTISAAYGAALTKWEEELLEINDSEWQELTADSRIRPIAFPLNERRRRAREKLDPQQEVLANDLAIDGYHGWQDLYNAVVGRISIPVEENGEVKHLSVGQAANMMHHSDRAVRSQVFAKWLEAWEKESELVAQSLNHLGGFRLQLYRHRGWDSVLKEPLDINRMTEATLDAMWQAIDNRKDRLVAYLERKAKLLG